MGFGKRVGVYTAGLAATLVLSGCGLAAYEYESTVVGTTGGETAPPPATAQPGGQRTQAGTTAGGAPIYVVTSPETNSSSTGGATGGDLVDATGEAVALSEAHRDHYCEAILRDGKVLVGAFSDEARADLDAIRDGKPRVLGAEAGMPGSGASAAPVFPALAEALRAGTAEPSQCAMSLTELDEAFAELETVQRISGVVSGGIESQSGEAVIEVSELSPDLVPAVEKLAGPFTSVTIIVTPGLVVMPAGG